MGKINPILFPHKKYISTQIHNALSTEIEKLKSAGN